MEAQVTSKTQRKKMAKRAMREASKAERKAKDKEKKKEKKKMRSEEERKAWAILDEEGRNERRRLAKLTREARSLEEAERRRRVEDALENGMPLVLDMSFGNMMKEQEINSLGSQLMFAYAANLRARSPFCLWLTGLEEGGEMEEALGRICGTDRWLIRRTTKCYVEQFHDRKEDLVYLTADAKEEVHELDEKKIYIVGGIVDRNRHKNVTYEKAKDQGIAKARLPIHQHIKLSTSAVLTVNQVVDILLAYKELKDWKAALSRVIPERKRTWIEALETDTAKSPEQTSQPSI